MQYIKQSILLVLLLLTSVMSYADNTTYTVSTSTGTFSNNSSSYYNTWTSSTTSPTTLTLKSYSEEACSSLVYKIYKKSTSSSYRLYANNSSSASYFQLAVGNGYKIVSYTLSYSTSNASASVTSGTTNTINKQTATFNVTSNSSSGFGPGGGGSSTSYYITPSSFSVIVAPIDYNITYNLDGGTNDSSNPSTFTVENVVTFANPTKAGYTFKGWTDASGNTVTSTANITEDITLTANWEQSTFNVTCNASTNGTVTASSTSNIKSGDQITLTITPDTDYELNTLTVKDASNNDVTVTDNKFTMPNSNVTVTATFKQIIKQVTQTYTRTSVTSGTWESFCLPMNVTMTELLTHFDKVYIPYDGKAITATPSASKRRKAESTSTSTTTVTATAEPYSVETSYWTDEEEKAASTRYTFAYSAIDSKYYHFYIADFTAETDSVLPQGTPFFAHLKSDATLTDNTLTITGYLWSNETALTGLVTKTFNVYSDNTLQTLDATKTFNAFGELTTGTYTTTGTIFAINSADGTFSATTDGMSPNHAYLNISPTEDASILTHPKTVEVLKSLQSVDDEDPAAVLNLTDTEYTLVAGTYAAGNVTYTRTGSAVAAGKYGSFCLPFDFNVSDATCFTKVYVPIKVSFYNTSTEKLRIFLVNQTGTIVANTPFLALLYGDAVSVKNLNSVTYDGTSTNPQTTELTVFDNDGSAVLISDDNIKLYWGGTLTSTEPIEGMYSFKTNGNFGDCKTTLPPFRAYLLKTIINSSVKVNNIEMLFGDDEPTSIEDLNIDGQSIVNVYDVKGILVRKAVNKENAIDDLQPGMYIINNQKVLKR